MKVLVGVGGTERSFAALEGAIERAEQADDELTVVIFDDPSASLSRGQVRERVQRIVAETDVNLSTKEIDGDPGSQLVQVAEDGGFDQLIIGNGTRTPMGKIQLDSIAQFVLFNSHVTVKLVR
ncbi:universal stress protein [Halorhabdus amylolytica]|uniref:universal stress protein n=1 Tax=Halorhabdus amylolytica TaxID=2559573 RepID=UPI0010AA1E03|nr:universal stress protein [Halorhabdus amylolytica]